jgi:hypothetical protein
MITPLALEKRKGQGLFVIAWSHCCNTQVFHFAKGEEKKRRKE